MSDEWKVPGTEPEENQQTVVEETETAEVTDGKENEEAAAEETAETTEGDRAGCADRAGEVTETAEEVRQAVMHRLGDRRSENTVSMGSGAWKRRKKRSCSGAGRTVCAGDTGTATGTGSTAE